MAINPFMASTIRRMRLVCRVGADYLSELLYTPERVIQDAERHLAGVQFNSIAGSGLSGALAAPLLARHFRVPFAVIRKPNDRSDHSSSDVEGTVGSRWLMVDDRIATGATCARVRHQIGQLRLPNGTAPRFVGLYLTKGQGAFWDPEQIPSLGNLRRRTRILIMTVRLSFITERVAHRTNKDLTCANAPYKLAVPGRLAATGEGGLISRSAAAQQALMSRCSGAMNVQPLPQEARVVRERHHSRECDDERHRWRVT